MKLKRVLKIQTFIREVSMFKVHYLTFKVLVILTYLGDTSKYMLVSYIWIFYYSMAQW